MVLALEMTSSNLIEYQKYSLIQDYLLYSTIDINVHAFITFYVCVQLVVISYDNGHLATHLSILAYSVQYVICTCNANTLITSIDFYRRDTYCAMSGHVKIKGPALMYTGHTFT